jgi:hypothetical protein
MARMAALRRRRRPGWVAGGPHVHYVGSCVTCGSGGRRAKSATPGAGRLLEGGAWASPGESSSVNGCLSRIFCGHRPGPATGTTSLSRLVGLLDPLSTTVRTVSKGVGERSSAPAAARRRAATRLPSVSTGTRAAASQLSTGGRLSLRTHMRPLVACRSALPLSDPAGVNREHRHHRDRRRDVAGLPPAEYQPVRGERRGWRAPGSGRSRSRPACSRPIAW